MFSRREMINEWKCQRAPKDGAAIRITPGSSRTWELCKGRVFFGVGLISQKKFRTSFSSFSKIETTGIKNPILPFLTPSQNLVPRDSAAPGYVIIICICVTLIPLCKKVKYKISWCVFKGNTYLVLALWLGMKQSLAMCQDFTKTTTTRNH